MNYRTLIVYVPFEEGADSLIQHAASLAERHHAHLVGFNVLPNVNVPFAWQVPSVMRSEFDTRHRQSAKHIGDQFESITAGREFSAEWRVMSEGDFTLERLLVMLGHTADLLIMEEPEDPQRRAGSGAFTTRVLSHSGRPVLLMPPHMPPESSFGRRVFIPWDGLSASTRALFGAIPLLQQADDVRLQRIHTGAPGQEQIKEITQYLADTLERHGVKVEIFHADARTAEIADAITGLVEEWQADMMVCGCLEHGRLHEFMVGSITRHLLEHATIPMLMSN